VGICDGSPECSTVQDPSEGSKSDMNDAEREKLENDLEYIRRVRRDMDRIAGALERYVAWHRDHPEAAAVFKMFLHSEEDEE